MGCCSADIDTARSCNDGSSCLFCQCRPTSAIFHLAADAGDRTNFHAQRCVADEMADPGLQSEAKPEVVLANAKQTRSIPSTTKLGTVWKAFHVLFWFFSRPSVIAIAILTVSEVSVGLANVQHLLSQLRRMNALTFYKELYDWLMSNVTANNMFLIQSIATCWSLGWCVCPSDLWAAWERY